MKSRLRAFIIKRVLIQYVILAILGIIFIEQSMHTLLGLTLGSFFSLIRFDSIAATVSKVIAEPQRFTGISRNASRYIINQISAFVLLTVSLEISIPLFFGVTAGILLVPLAIMINGISEALGLSHNRFQ